VAPHGLAGGGPGAPGKNSLRHADGRITPLPSTGAAEVLAGETLCMETPGGGGFGDPSEPGAAQVEGEIGGAVGPRHR
ncbi:MAG TPA: hydantoinase B/oxoprolinase family protein, partial [Myxococcota bacterium]|nr:hydantoinase B/oxoprolinase family protein [Myxococcota bacterium]